MSNKGSIYVGNLPKTFTEDDLRQMFAEMGTIESAVMKTGKSRDGTQLLNYGFVNFEDSSSVDASIANCQGKVVQGNVLTVRRSEKSKKNLTGNAGRPNPNWNGTGPQNQNKRGSEDTKKLQGYEEVVSITHVIDPHTLYVQALNRDNLEKFSVIMSKLHDHCSSAPRLQDNQLDRSKVYGAIFQEDGAWYRCRVTNHNQIKAEVLYIDYGNSAEVDIDTMVQLSDELAAIGAIAQKIKIIGVAPSLKESSSDAANQAYAFLRTIEGDTESGKQMKVIIAEGMMPQKDGSLPVQLFHDGTNVAQTLNKKFAPSYQEKPAHLSNRVPQTTPGGGGGGVANKWKKKEVQGGGDVAAVNGINGPKPHHQHNKEMNDLMKRVQNLEGVLEQLKDDKFVLQKQLLHYKSEAEKAADEEAKKKRCILQSNLTPLAESFQKIKDARKGFSIDLEQKNTIQLAIDLAAKRLQQFKEGSPTKEKGDIISLIPDSEPVSVRLTELEEAQQVFGNIQSQDELRDPMLKRNDARHEAYKALTNFLDDVKKLPISKRLKDIETMVNQLESEYGTYLDPTKVMQSDQGVADMECFDEYQAWLEGRRDHISPLRATTDELRMMWCELLTNMNKSFLFDDISSPCLDSVDKLRGDFLLAMETELTFTVHGYTPSIELADKTALQKKQEMDVREVEVISSTVRALVDTMVKEKQTLASLDQVCGNYANMAAQLNPWLNNKPDVSCLQAVMKEIKGLRSKLRHKLADKRDFEEDSEEQDEKCMKELDDEICNIQEKLWNLYQKEDSLMRELSELTSRHFPELPVLYPTIRITKFLETNGLVKEGRDLTHFDLSPVPGCPKSTVKVAKVNGTPVSIIKVLHLPNENTIKKMIGYSMIDIPTCLKLRAVYPESDNSQLFLQLPYVALGNLETAVTKDGLLSRRDVVSVCRDVLLALEGLHRLGLVHGGVHPRNILLEQREDKSQKPYIFAYLSELDFTRTTSEAALKGFTTETGIRFTAPEVNCGLQASSQADVFACGLLILWALFPTRVFKVEPDGTPDVQGSDLSPSLTELLVSMLNYSPSKRPSATRVLEHEFFTRPPGHDDVASMSTEEGDVENVTLSESTLSDIPEGEDNQMDPRGVIELPPKTSPTTSKTPQTPPGSPLKEPTPTRSPPGQLTQTSPEQLTQASPGQLTQASPVQLTQASPEQLTQASPGQLTQVSPMSLTHASPGRIAHGSPLKPSLGLLRQATQESAGCDTVCHDDVAPVDQKNQEEIGGEKVEAVVQDFSQCTLESPQKEESKDDGDTSDCDEPPPLEDDEVHEVPNLDEGNSQSQEPTGVINSEADDNSSPV